MATTATAATNQCALCQAPASNRCARCKSVFYCCADHQRQDWKTHKATCNDTFQADQHTLHKKAFDRIIEKYKLQSKAGEISEYITETPGIAPSDFAKRYGMDAEEAIVFLEWINVGVKFKEDTLDVAKKSGILDGKR